VVAILYYGQRHVTANKEIKKPEDMKGMKLRVQPAPLFLMFTKSVGANATPIAFAEVYLALQQGTVDGQENPLPTIMAKKFYEVQSHIMLTGHITESLVTIVGSHVWSKLSDTDKKVFEEVLMQAERGDSNRPDPRLRAQARRRIPQARQDRGGSRPRGIPQGCRSASYGRQCGRRLVAGRIRRAAGFEIKERVQVTSCRAQVRRDRCDLSRGDHE
jgi:hypothetical protein